MYCGWSLGFHLALRSQNPPGLEVRRLKPKGAFQGLRRGTRPPSLRRLKIQGKQAVFRYGDGLQSSTSCTCLPGKIGKVRSGDTATLPSEPFVAAVTKRKSWKALPQKKEGHSVLATMVFCYTARVHSATPYLVYGLRITWGLKTER